ncbi:hypothetical protein R3P38DRAFT_3234238 [Favolaschia claudopus]|uniref:Uncharacterized protein n=1 Tax=Favolaschia claudopus TaxID=2862362 RepID=A0AAV9ZHA8_9AGAR
METWGRHGLCIRSIQQWIGSGPIPPVASATTSELYSLHIFTPVDGADRLNVDTFLNHKLVMHIAVAIIYGKKKANKMARNQPCSSGPRCMREIHNISNFTPGFIACAGTIGLRSRSKPVLALFREWDEEIFPESETSLGAVKEMDVGASAGHLNAALDAIRNAEVEEDVEMGGADNTGNAGNGEEEGDEDQY